MAGTARDPIADLNRIGYLLERAREPTYRVRAFRAAARLVAALPPGELADRAASGRLTSLPGIGPVTATCISESLAGTEPGYLSRLEESATGPLAAGGEQLCSALRGDLHSHSEASDGGSPIVEMALAARALGHDYLAVTDHSPRLIVAHGLSADALREQLAEVRALNAELAPFRVLTGIEVDINDDGSLDQEPALLAALDVVVASVHSKLRMPPAEMTRRLVTAIANPHVDVLGHPTGRLVAGRGRPESTFDAEIVFAACARFGVAVEINSRPERLDPPRRLAALALQLGTLFAIDTDAHAPGQLEWQPFGCARAAECGIPAERIVNSWPVEALLAWTGRAG